LLSTGYWLRRYNDNCVGGMSLYAFVQTAVSIAEKDMRVEFRRSYEVLSVLIFSLGAVMVCSYTFSGYAAPEVASAFLWIILFFAAILIFTTSFTRESDRGTLGGLKTIPCSSLAILLGKIIYGALMLLVTEIVLSMFSVVFLGIDIIRMISAMPILLIGALALSSAGSFISGLVMFSEGKTLLLSFLLFPVCLPVLMSGNVATSQILSGSSMSEVMPAVEMLIAFLMIITFVMSSTFEFVIEE